jgi:hypothetical protein
MFRSPFFGWFKKLVHPVDAYFVKKDEIKAR